jgi:hypothetical protein
MGPEEQRHRLGRVWFVGSQSSLARSKPCRYSFPSRAARLVFSVSDGSHQDLSEQKWSWQHLIMPRLDALDFWRPRKQRLRSTHPGTRHLPVEQAAKPLCLCSRLPQLLADPNLQELVSAILVSQNPRCPEKSANLRAGQHLEWAVTSGYSKSAPVGRTLGTVKVHVPVEAFDLAASVLVLVGNRLHRAGEKKPDEYTVGVW